MFDTILTKVDLELLGATRNKIQDFIPSEDDVLNLEPMNSYRRRLMHKLGAVYHLESKSAGEGEGRFICFIKTPETSLPKKPVSFASKKVIDFGNQVFQAKEGVTIVLRADRSFGLPQKGEREGNILDKCVIKGEMFRILKSRIVCDKT